MSETVPMWMIATKKNYYIVDTGSTGTGNDKFESTTLQEYTVPDGKRWILLYGAINRSDNATVNVRILNSTGKIIAHLCALAAGTGYSPLIPTISSGSTQGSGGPYILDEGEQVQINFGAAQGATASISCVVLEFARSDV